MVRKSKKGQTFRHTPAFILLFLARENLYGGALLSKMESQLPSYNPDSAAVYRALQELEEEEAVKAYWETDISGPARKWYEITEKGYERLAEFKEDIEKRMRNFEYFLQFSKAIFDQMEIKKRGIENE